VVAVVADVAHVVQITDLAGPSAWLFEVAAPLVPRAEPRTAPYDTAVAADWDCRTGIVYRDCCPTPWRWSRKRLCELLPPFGRNAVGCAGMTRSMVRFGAAR
jgi:hypothetical protein